MRPRLLLLNQYYWPGVEATAHLLSELCEGLAEDFDVTVVTGRVRGRPELPAAERRNGVEIVRVSSTSYDRSQIFRRALNYVTYLASAPRVALSQPRPDIVLCGTDPPIIGTVALSIARRRGVPLVVISEDVFPEVAVALNRLRNGPLIALLRVLVSGYLRRADRVVAIGETMSRRLQAKGARPERIRVIPNWTDVAALAPRPKANPWSIEHGVADKFVVMHSGNVGHAQDLDALIRSTTLLRDLDDLRVLVVGRGARWAELVELRTRLEVDSVEFLDFQPRDRLADALAAADVHVVGLARGLAGYVVPSRFYGILAAGRPVIAAAEEESETAAAVRRTGCGIVVPPGDPLRLAQVIRECRDGLHDLTEMGARARAYAEAEAGKPLALSRYRAVLEEVRGGR